MIIGQAASGIVSAQSKRCGEVESEVRAWICRNKSVPTRGQVAKQYFSGELVSKQTEIISRPSGRIRIRVQREGNQFEGLMYGGASKKYKTMGTPAMEIKVNLLGEIFRASKVEN